MGFRYRKSINLGGGFRVNISKSGIGYSWGVKGYRITKTADGRVRQTASIPGTGISYVEEHSIEKKSSESSKKHSEKQHDLSISDLRTVTTDNVEDYGSAEYDELFKKIYQKTYLIAGLLILSVVSFAIAPLLPIPFLVCLIYVCAKGSVSIDYDFDEESQKRWEDVSQAWRDVACSEYLQEIDQQAKVENKRDFAGIDKGMSTVPVKAIGAFSLPFSTNVIPVVFKFKNFTMAIMPDRLFLKGKSGYSAIRYEDLKIDITAIGFLEKEKKPSDAEVAKTVWLHMNDDGTPDKRYKNNPKVELLKYGKIVITSNNGLNIQFMCSDESASDKLFHVLYPGKPDPSSVKE